MSKAVPDRNFLIHPSAVIMILIFIGLGAVFVSLSLAYVYTRVTKHSGGVSTPGIFLITTLLLLAASYTIHRLQQAFRRREEPHIASWGWLTLGLSILFMIGQAVAWYQLLAGHQAPGSSVGMGYLYALSILHFLHVMVGLPFLARIIMPLTRASRQGTLALLFIDEDFYRCMRHTAWYWHFLDIIWLYVAGFLLVQSAL